MNPKAVPRGIRRGGSQYLLNKEIIKGQTGRKIQGEGEREKNRIQPVDRVVNFMPKQHKTFKWGTPHYRENICRKPLFRKPDERIGNFSLKTRSRLQEDQNFHVTGF